MFRAFELCSYTSFFLYLYVPKSVVFERSNRISISIEELKKFEYHSFGTLKYKQVALDPHLLANLVDFVKNKGTNVRKIA